MLPIDTGAINVTLATFQDDPKTTALDKAKRYGWKITQNLGDMVWVSKRLLLVDHRYQRGEQKNKIAEIRRDWNWLACGVLTVGRRDDGSLWVLEGQQRLAAAKGRSDISELPCIIFDVADVREEARAFLDTNKKRKPVSHLDTFRAALVEGDPTATACWGLITGADYDIGKSAGRTVSCVGLMQKLHRMDADALERVWPLVVQVSDGGFIHERLLEALWYLARNATPDITLQPFSGKVVRIGRDELLEAAAKAAAYFTRGGGKVWAQGLMDRINKGARSNLLEWKSGEAQ